ncbi:hypothetical protein Taro_044549 [Colocasia esculenta]|uniref:Uncharacterized protein n=1 Tax=Colocasia esculenta TaxID=4460 RepID=A0A843WNZ0_COLES|nr:hypothetical protein [Colocasia esculenta]
MGYHHTADSVPSSSTLKQWIRSAGYFYYCFYSCGGVLEPSSSSSDGLQPPALLIQIEGAGALGARGAVVRHRHHVRYFGYDALCYALNFDNGPDLDDEGEILP